MYSITVCVSNPLSVSLFQLISDHVLISKKHSHTHSLSLSTLLLFLLSAVAAAVLQ